MHLETELSHISTERTVVKVQAWEGDKSLGSTLGEGKTIDIAEENAIVKLKSRLKAMGKVVGNNDKTQSTSTFTPKQNIFESKISSNSKFKDQDEKIPLANKQNEDKMNIPNDWGEELSAIDKELKRLKWQKEEELVYLKILFGYSSRSKITKYIELKVLLMNLKELPSGSKPSSSCDTKETLITKSSIILNKLKWDSIKGREFLQENFEVSTRQDLNKIQLMQFNLLLSEELQVITKSKSI